MSNCAKDSYFQFINTASPQVSSQPSIFLVHLLSHFLGLLFHTFSLSSHIPNTPHSQLTELNFLRKEVSIFPPDPGRGWCKILSKSCLYTWLTCPAPLSCTHSSEALISVVDAILVRCPAWNSQSSFTPLLHRICHDWSLLCSWTISLPWQRGHHHLLIFLMAHWLHLPCLYCWILFFLRPQAGIPQSSVLLPSLFYTHSLGEFIHTPSFTKHVHTKALNLSLVPTLPWALDLCTQCLCDIPFWLTGSHDTWENDSPSCLGRNKTKTTLSPLDTFILLLLICKSLAFPINFNLKLDF